jgi:probable addiction module antidote protein
VTEDYREYLLERLRKSSDGGAGYLSAALEEGAGAFLVAIRDVVDARLSVSRLASKTGLHRVSLHTALSKRGNPRMDSLERVLGALNLRLAVVPVEKRRKAKAS